MADILSTGVSGLRAFQRALDVTSHNIANATTPGYSRQRAELGTRVPEKYGNGYLGTGVTINSISRTYDQLLTSQLRSATSTLSRFEAYAEKAQVLNNLFADSTVGLSAAMQRFSSAVQGVANDPTSTAARQVLLSEANGLQQRLDSYGNRLDELEAEINSRVVMEASSITVAAAGIARLNDQIVSAQAAGQMPNDLLDSRDQLIKELASHLTVTVVPQNDGAWNVFIGNGQSLVVGATSAQLVAKPDTFDPGRMAIAYGGGGGSLADITSTISGGSLGGLTDFRREMLDPARNELGRIAVGLATVANAQHREGMDLYGDLGGDLFRIGAVQVSPETLNTGTGTLAVTRSDVGAMTADNYVLDYDGSVWTARNAITGAAVAMTGAGTVASPFSFGGLSVVVGGAAAAGDRFLVRPTATAIAGLEVAIDDPSRIAAAAPIRASATTTNIGSGTISAGEVLDATNPQLRSTVTITFLDATTYSVNGAGSFAYTAGADIDINGWRASISGAPQAGDTFTVANNAGGVGDNRNALALSQTLGRGVLGGGTESIDGAISRFIGGIGIATNQVRTSAEAQNVIVNDVTGMVDAVSGVNLDEEAANMLRYQQAYQAAAQVIRITQTLFDTLMASTHR